MIRILESLFTAVLIGNGLIIIILTSMVMLVLRRQGKIFSIINSVGAFGTANVIAEKLPVKTETGPVEPEKLINQASIPPVEGNDTRTGLYEIIGEKGNRSRLNSEIETPRPAKRKESRIMVMSKAEEELLAAMQR